MTTIPFGTQTTVAAAPAPPAITTPTVIGVIGLTGAGATAAAGQLTLVHSKTEMIGAVGSDGELNAWAEEFYSRDTGRVLISPVAAHDVADDTARNAAASAALEFFKAGQGPTGLLASIIDVHDYGTQVNAGDETDASPVIAAAEGVAEATRGMIYANFPAASTDALATWHTDFATWLDNNRKPRVLCVGGDGRTGANSTGFASSTIFAAVRAALDGQSSVAEPLYNKPISNIVGTYPEIPYSVNRSASLVGRTLQNTHGGNFIANSRGWKTVVGELKTAQASDPKRYESILRAVDLSENEYEAAMADHLGTPNRDSDQAALLQELDNVTSSLRQRGIIDDAKYELRTNVSPNANDKFVINLAGEIETQGVVIQINSEVEVK